MFSVYTKTLQTDKGKSFVCGHEDDYDAQVIHKERIAHAQRSIKASVDASSLLTISSMYTEKEIYKSMITSLRDHIFV